MIDAVIRTEGLRKRFGSTEAVAGISLEIRRGEVFGFLGPNGAGKTTTIKLLLGLVAKTGGEAWVLGEPPGAMSSLGRVGFLPEHFRFPSWLSAAEFLDLHGRLYKMSGERRRKRVSELLERVGLADRSRSHLGEFSKGMLQRIGLAQALLNEPDLVILDEPTSGLDPVGRRQVRDLIGELREAGVTVFLNSHLLSEVEATCDRMAVIKRGRVVRIGTLEELAGPSYELEIRADGLDVDRWEELERWGPVTRLGPDLLRITLRNTDAVPQIAVSLVRGGAGIRSLTPRRTPLEDLFIRILEESP